MVDDHDKCEWVNVFWYWLTRVVLDKIQRAVKWLCVCFYHQLWYSKNFTTASLCIRNENVHTFTDVNNYFMSQDSAYDPKQIKM